MLSRRYKHLRFINSAALFRDPLPKDHPYEDQLFVLAHVSKKDGLTRVRIPANAPTAAMSERLRDAIKAETGVDLPLVTDIRAGKAGKAAKGLKLLSAGAFLWVPGKQEEELELVLALRDEGAKTMPLHLNEQCGVCDRNVQTTIMKELNEEQAIFLVNPTNNSAELLLFSHNGETGISMHEKEQQLEVIRNRKDRPYSVDAFTSIRVRTVDLIPEAVSLQLYSNVIVYCPGERFARFRAMAMEEIHTNTQAFRWALTFDPRQLAQLSTSFRENLRFTDAEFFGREMHVRRLSELSDGKRIDSLVAYVEGLNQLATTPRLVKPMAAPYVRSPGPA